MSRRILISAAELFGLAGAARADLLQLKDGRIFEGVKMTKEGEAILLHYENGTIMDPRDGQVYRALMRLSPDGKVLEVRGFLGIALLGRSQTWNRLPDNALDPAPGRPAPKGAPKAAPKN